MDVLTKRPMMLGTVKIDIGTPLTVPDSIGKVLLTRDLATEAKKKGRRKNDDSRHTDNLL